MPGEILYGPHSNSVKRLILKLAGTSHQRHALEIAERLLSSDKRSIRSIEVVERNMVGKIKAASLRSIDMGVSTCFV